MKNPMQGCRAAAPHKPQPSARALAHAAQLRRLWARADLTTREIGQLLGVSQPTVSNWARQLGLASRAGVGSNASNLGTHASRHPEPKLFRCRCGAVVTESRAVDVCIHREGAA